MNRVFAWASIKCKQFLNYKTNFISGWNFGSKDYIFFVSASTVCRFTAQISKARIVGYLTWH